VKKEIHPEYRTVLFHDVSVDKYYLIPSTLETDQTKEWEDGNTYPYCPLDVSSASHPFYTGQNKIIDTGGRVERFKKRFSKKKAAVKAAPTEESAQEETPLAVEKEDVKASASAEELTKETPEAPIEENSEAAEAAPTDAPQEENSTEEASDESSKSSEEK
tara:strand:- start:81 stop:563 length:483 start_codon:yes stop_codon:yes gene_type:complete